MKVKCLVVLLLPLLFPCYVAEEKEAGGKSPKNYILRLFWVLMAANLFEKIYFVSTR